LLKRKNAREQCTQGQVLARANWTWHVQNAYGASTQRILENSPNNTSNFQMSKVKEKVKNSKPKFCYWHV
jgi:hypothetical protein